MAAHNPARHPILQPDYRQKHIAAHATLASPA